MRFGHRPLIRGIAALLALSGLLASGASAQTCAAGQPDEQGVCPTVLHMEKGAYGLAVTGHISPERYRDTYALKVGARQTLIISFTGAHEMTGEIACGDTGDGPWYGGGNVYTTDRAGTCFISVGANTRAGDPWSGNYTLAVLVTRPQNEP